MTALTHCDNSACDATADQGYDNLRPGAALWLTVEVGDSTLNFHSQECLSAFFALPVTFYTDGRWIRGGTLPPVSRSAEGKALA